MRLYKTLILASLIGLQFLLSNFALAASDCVNTPWVKSNGRTCANVGLNSKKPTCNGQAYAVMCDDTKTHIRTCRSNVQCGATAAADPYSIGGGTFTPAPSYGTTNSNSSSNNGSGNDYEVFRGKKFHCTEWDYKKKRPCKNGTFNEDCWGNCS